MSMMFLRKRTFRLAYDRNMCILSSAVEYKIYEMGMCGTQHHHLSLCANTHLANNKNKFWFSKDIWSTYFKKPFVFAVTLALSSHFMFIFFSSNVCVCVSGGGGEKLMDEHTMNVKYMSNSLAYIMFSAGFSDIHTVSRFSSLSCNDPFFLCWRMLILNVYFWSIWTAILFRSLKADRKRHKKGATSFKETDKFYVFFLSNDFHIYNHTSKHCIYRQDIPANKILNNLVDGNIVHILMWNLS